jgi:hypothetical protein
MHISRRAQRLILMGIALALVASVLSVPNRALACDPAEPLPPPEKARDDATAVFSGEVIDIGVLGETEEYAVRFAVERVWKGVSESEVTVRTFIDQGICGFPFEEGESYLVYAYGEPEDLTTSLIDRTTRWDRADSDLNALGPGRPVDEVVVGEPVDAGSGDRVWILPVAVVAVGLFAGVIMYLRRAHATADESENGG